MKRKQLFNQTNRVTFLIVSSIKLLIIIAAELRNLFVQYQWGIRNESGESVGIQTQLRIT